MHCINSIRNLSSCVLISLTLLYLMNAFLCFLNTGIQGFCNFLSSFAIFGSFKSSDCFFNSCIQSLGYFFPCFTFFNFLIFFADGFYSFCSRLTDIVDKFIDWIDYGFILCIWIFFFKWIIFRLFHYNYKANNILIKILNHQN